MQAAKLARQTALEVQVGKWLAPAIAEQVNAEISSVSSDDAGAYRITGVPLNRGRPGVLSDERREMFRAHLTALIQTALVQRDELANTDAPPPVRYSNEVDTAEMSAVLGAACAQCRGQCCHNGGSHAFLTAHEMLAHLIEHPQHSAEDIIALYESYLPEQTLVPGCVYQHETGCVLPRDMRSDTCNWFYCDALTEFKRDHVPDTPVRAFFVQVGNDDPEQGTLATASFVQLLRRAPVEGSA